MCSARAGETKTKPTATHDSHVARRISFLPVLFSARLSRVQRDLQAAGGVEIKAGGRTSRARVRADDAECRNGAENVRFWLPAQPIDATHASNLSAGVSNLRVLRGR